MHCLAHLRREKQTSKQTKQQALFFLGNHQECYLSKLLAKKNLWLIFFFLQSCLTLSSALLSLKPTADADTIAPTVGPR